MSAVIYIGLIIAYLCLWLPIRKLYQTMKQHDRIIRELQDREREEDRCHFCKDQAACPAFDTGVLYPCPYFEEDRYGAEK